HENIKKYDGLIVIICGHGEDGNMLVSSDGSCLSINEMRTTFNCNKMDSFKYFPKIFIVDVCRGESIPTAHKIIMRGKNTTKDMPLYGHNDDGFLTIWSTTQGHQAADISLLSNCMTKVIKSKYKSGYPLKKMLDNIRQDIRERKHGEWYCVEKNLHKIFFFFLSKKDERRTAIECAKINTIQNCLPFVAKNKKAIIK
ncbi:hypothetical protein RFI_36492, partial [Reticulomyxa filosa]